MPSSLFFASSKLFERGEKKTVQQHKRMLYVLRELISELSLAAPYSCMLAIVTEGFSIEDYAIKKVQVLEPCRHVKRFELIFMAKFAHTQGFSCFTSSK